MALTDLLLLSNADWEIQIQIIKHGNYFPSTKGWYLP